MRMVYQSDDCSQTTAMFCDLNASHRGGVSERRLFANHSTGATDGNGCIRATTVRKPQRFGDVQSGCIRATTVRKPQRVSAVPMTDSGCIRATTVRKPQRPLSDEDKAKGCIRATTVRKPQPLNSKMACDHQVYQSDDCSQTTAANNVGSIVSRGVSERRLFANHSEVLEGHQTA